MTCASAQTADRKVHSLAKGASEAPWLPTRAQIYLRDTVTDLRSGDRWASPMCAKEREKRRALRLAARRGRIGSRKCVHFRLPIARSTLAANLATRQPQSNGDQHSGGRQSRCAKIWRSRRSCEAKFQAAKLPSAPQLPHLCGKVRCGTRQKS